MLGHAACGDGASSAKCPDGQTACSRECVNTRYDPQNCGQCGAACDPGSLCSDSSCVSVCSPGLTRCDGACVDVRDDHAHCGDCVTACSADELCVAGRCLSSGWVDARTYGDFQDDAAISAALAVIGGSYRTLYLGPGTWTIANDLTIPANVNLRVEWGALLTIASVSMTINGGLEASLHRIFATTGTGRVALGADTGASHGGWRIKEAFPEWWGAAGDGVADDTAAFQQCLDSGASSMATQSTTYKIGGGLSRALTADFRWTGNATVLDGSLSDADTLLLVNGQVGAGAGMDSDPAAGDSSFACAGLAGVVTPGEVLLIKSTDLWITLGGRPVEDEYYLKGEFVTVAGTSGNDILLTQALYDNYVGVNTTVYRPTIPKVSMSGVAIVREGVKAGMTLALAKAIDLENLRFTGGRAHGLFVNWIYGGRLTNIYSNNCFNPAEEADSYGAILGSVQDLVVTGNQFLDGSHGLAIGGGGDYAGIWGAMPNRNINLSDNVFDNNIDSGRPSLNAHGNVEFLSVVGNRILNGAGLASINTSVSNNIINCKTATAGITFAPQRSSSFYAAEGNYIYCPLLGADGIDIAPNLGNTTIDTLVIADNTVYGQRYALSFSANATSGTTSTINLLSLEGNRLKSSSASLGQQLATIYASANGGIFYTINRLEIIGGEVVSTDSDPVFVTLANGGVVQLVGGYYEGNRGPSGRGVRFLNAGAQAGSLEASDVYFKSNGAFNEFDRYDYVSMADCRFEGYASSGGQAITNCTRSLLDGNDHRLSNGCPAVGCAFPVTVASQCTP
jgi:hypothetical protein